MGVNSKYRYRQHRCHPTGIKNIATICRTPIKCMHCGLSNFQKTTFIKMECFYCGLVLEDDHPYLRITPHDFVTFGTPEQYDNFVNMVLPVLSPTWSPY